MTAKKITKVWETIEQNFSFTYLFDYSKGSTVDISVTIGSIHDTQASPPPSPPNHSETPVTLTFSSGLPSRAKMLEFDLQSPQGLPIKGQMDLNQLSLLHSTDNAGIWIDVAYGENLSLRSEGIFTTYKIQA